MTDIPTGAPPSRTGPQNFPSIGGLLPKRSHGLKLLLVCALALLMSIPALFVYGVVADRQSGKNLAFNQVSASVGGQQAALGPVMVLPYSRVPDPDKPDRVVYGNAIAFAETGAVTGNVDVQTKTRGIYVVPTFNAHLNFDAEFDPSALRDAVPIDASPIWADARIYMGISDTRGISESYELRINGQRVKVEPAPYVNSGNYQPVPASGVQLAAGKFSGLQTAQNAIKVKATMKFSGAERLSVGPFAKDTTLELDSNWPDPSFTGGIIPDAHNVGESADGAFSARWTVPYLARDIPGAGAYINLSNVTSFNHRDMAVRFVQEANPYQSVERALKYAVMFIGFVFLAYFLFEITSAARAHPAQYILVGLAQTIFYLLLLAFAEKIGFDLAFLISATMTVSLTSFYAMSVFRSRSYGLRAFVILSGIYGLIYVLMRAEGHALLAGALVSFAAIALTMFMTRNINWYGEDK